MLAASGDCGGVHYFTAKVRPSTYIIGTPAGSGNDIKTCKHLLKPHSYFVECSAVQSSTFVPGSSIDRGHYSHRRSGSEKWGCKREARAISWRRKNAQPELMACTAISTDLFSCTTVCVSEYLEINMKRAQNIYTSVVARKLQCWLHRKMRQRPSNMF